MMGPLSATGTTTWGRAMSELLGSLEITIPNEPPVVEQLLPVLVDLLKAIQELNELLRRGKCDDCRHLRQDEEEDWCSVSGRHPPDDRGRSCTAWKR